MTPNRSNCQRIPKLLPPVFLNSHSSGATLRRDNGFFSLRRLSLTLFLHQSLSFPRRRLLLLLFVLVPSRLSFFLYNATFSLFSSKRRLFLSISSILPRSGTIVWSRNSVRNHTFCKFHFEHFSIICVDFRKSIGLMGRARGWFHQNVPLLMQLNWKALKKTSKCFSGLSFAIPFWWSSWIMILRLCY